VKDCEQLQLLPNGFIFQQDDVPAQTARASRTEHWLKSNCM